MENERGVDNLKNVIIIIMKIIITIRRPAMPGSNVLHGKLTDRGFRLTFSRQVILNLFQAKPQDLSAEDVFFAVHRKYPGIGIATVYRNLEILTRAGLLSKFDFGDGPSRYEITSETKKGHHHHLICTRCGRIINYSDFMEKEVKFIQELEAELSKKYNFKIENHQIHFQGLCDECQ